MLRALGPVGRSSLKEAVRSGLGALIGLGLVGLLVLGPTVDLKLGLYLVAPFGATSVLIFAVPNSPLAQPWSAIVGNTSAALVGVTVTLLVEDPTLRVPLAVGAAITAMSLVRAVHPPAGAVAMTVALSPDTIQALGFRFALAPIAIGTTLLVLVACLYAHATGRRYPFRQFDEPHDQGTLDHPPTERLGLSEAELVDILQRYRQTLNLGVEDLARLIGAAEVQAASHMTRAPTAEEIMSRDLVTVEPDAPLALVADLFQRHGFTSLPVVQDGNKYLGVIYQIHLIRAARGGHQMGLVPSISRLLEISRPSSLQAADLMLRTSPIVKPATPAGALLPALADGTCDAVPVLERGRIVGIVTRSDLIAFMARESLRA